MNLSFKKIYDKITVLLCNKRYLAFAVISFVLFLLYSNVINGGFVYDDKNFIADNKPIKTWLFTRPWDFFTKPEVAVWSGIYRPLRTLSFAVDYQLFGLNTVGYHVENILFHILNCWLMFLVLSKVLKSERKSFFAVLLFAVHPVNIESVSWISSRADLMFASVVLYCFYLFIKWQPDSIHKITKVILWNILYFIGLLSKETAIGLAPAVFVYDMMFNYKSIRILGLKQFVKSRWLFYLSVALVSVGYIVMRFSLFENVSQKPYWGGSVYSNFLTMLDATVYYFRIIFYPIGLSVDYSTYPIVYSILTPSFIVGLAFYLCCFLLIVMRIVKRDLVTVYLCLFFVFFLMPSWNIFPISAIIADRFLYVPSIGIFAIAGCVMGKYMDLSVNFVWYKKAVLPMIFVFFALMCLLCVYRNNDWRSDMSLWKSCVDEFPGNFKGHINLGTCYDDAQQYDLAIDQYYRLIAYQKHHAMAYYNLGNIYWNLGMFKQSQRNFLTALKYNPRYIEAMNNLASLYVDKGWYKQAQYYFLRVLSINSRYAKAHYNLANIYYSHYKNYEKAKYHYLKCLRSDEFKRNGKIYAILNEIKKQEANQIKK